jgi:putative aldouronate transport system permease protein
MLKNKTASIRTGMDERVFDILNILFLSFLGLFFLYPIVYVFSASLSKPLYVATGSVIFFPKGISLDSFFAAAKLPLLWRSYANTIFYTAAGTIVNMILTCSGAYVLSKSELKGRSFWVLVVVVTMWFDPGIIPRYLNFRDLHLLNTYSSVIIGFGVNTFNLIILKTFFESIPGSLEESARIDGANQWQILRKIYLPLSTPALVTVALFYAVSRWNGYFWMMMLVTDDKKAPLQVLLKKLIVQKEIPLEGVKILDLSTRYSQDTIIYAVIVISIIPVLIVYPIVQRFFKNGIMLGAVKG